MTGEPLSGPSGDQLERRRKSAARWAWGLGLLVLLLYLGGLFIKR